MASFYQVLPIINLAVLILVHLVGLILAIVLLVKYKGTPAILATVAFGLAVIGDVGQLLRTTFLQQFIIRNLARTTDPRTAFGVSNGFACCCNILSVIGIVCLIIALWQAISGQGEGASPEPIQPV